MNKMNKITTLFLTIIAFSLSLILVVLDSTTNVYYGAKKVYRVYLDGKSIGLIKSKEELENYIDEEQQALKDEYNVERVYAPNGLKIKEEITYNENIMETKNLYEKIKETENFTIPGYKVTITPSEYDDKKEDIYIYLLNKNIFQNAVNETIKSFIDEEKYQLYLEENQPEITNTGEIIENVYVKEKITIKKDYIPANETIFKTEKELAKYLLFGTTKAQTKYKVKPGDTIKTIAAANMLLPSEFLIANQDLSDENSLLYDGQEVVISLIDPILTIVEEQHKVAIEEIKYKIETKEDSNFYVGYSEVIQKGENGQSKVTQKLKIENGQIVSVVPVSNEILKTAVNQIVKTGARTQYIVATTEYWAWPTRTPYIITDYYGPRWGRMHNGIDVSGTGHGSPLYAINDGTVVAAVSGHGNNMNSYGMATFGNYVDINHNNGYVSRYAHMADVYVKKGQAVRMGELIGTMGNSGYSTGTHLHLEIFYNGQYINPFLLYQ